MSTAVIFVAFTQISIELRAMGTICLHESLGGRTLNIHNQYSLICISIQRPTLFVLKKKNLLFAMLILWLVLFLIKLNI